MSGKSSGVGLDATLRDFSGGQKVFNRYTLIRTLGRGGMGIVWLAHDEVLERDVALKFVPELVVLDPGVLNDLRRETKRSLELTHKNIVRIYDFVQDNVSACISMEYIDGGTLSGLRVQKEKKIFEPNEISTWINQLCDALDYAHNHARIIHRDLKPSNLMVNQRGDLKVADFGIARSLSDSVSMLTHARGTSGTLVYMSPQQLDGERGTHLDDIYSLGATIYELLTSRPPFYSGDISRQIHEKTAPSMMQRRQDFEIEGNPIRKNWEETVAACLSKDPAKRPQSAVELGSRLGVASSVHQITPAQGAKESFKKIPSFIKQLWEDIQTEEEPSESASEIANRLEAPSPRYGAPPAPTAPKQPRKFAASFSLKWLGIGMTLAVRVGVVLFIAGGVWYFAIRPPPPPKPQVRHTPAGSNVAAIAPVPQPPSPPAEGGLWVDTTPAGAKVIVDGGSTVRRSPATFSNLAAGKHRLEIVLDNYMTEEREVEVKGGEVASQGIVLRGRTESRPAPAPNVVQEPPNKPPQKEGEQEVAAAKKPVHNKQPAAAPTANVAQEAVNKRPQTVNKRPQKEKE